MCWFDAERQVVVWCPAFTAVCLYKALPFESVCGDITSPKKCVCVCV